MYLHLGQDTLVNTRDVLGVFDLDTASLSKKTREFLAAAEKAGQVVNVTSELPKSFVLCVPPHTHTRHAPAGGAARGRRAGAGTLYISQLGSATLKKRLETGRGRHF